MIAFQKLLLFNCLKINQFRNPGKFLVFALEGKWISLVQLFRLPGEEQGCFCGKKTEKHL
jgi:hypothetical protein